MSISATCIKCLQVMKVAEKFAGRKALCPLCENFVAIPKQGEKAAAVAAVDFSTVIDRFAISDWDKAYCKLIVSQELVQKKAVRSAVIDVRNGNRLVKVDWGGGWNPPLPTQEPTPEQESAIERLFNRSESTRANSESRPRNDWLADELTDGVAGTLGLI